MFYLLPYRHINDVDKIEFIIHKFINIYNQNYDEYTKKPQKYIYNTLNNFYKFGNDLYITKSKECDFIKKINFDLNILRINHLI